MTDEERVKVKDWRQRKEWYAYHFHDWTWLLDLAESQEAELSRLRTALAIKDAALNPFTKYQIQEDDEVRMVHVQVIRRAAEARRVQP